MSLEDFYAQKNFLHAEMIQNEIREGAVRTVPDWEKAYGMPFCKYRAEVRNACEEVLERVGADRISLGVEYAKWYEDDEIILPIDDDDIFHPSVLQAVQKAFKPGINLVVWQRITNFLGVNRTEKIPRFLDTCNWAIRKNFLAETSSGLGYGGSDLCEGLIILSHHWKADGLVGRRLGIPGPKYRYNVMGVGIQQIPSLVQRRLNHPSVVELDEQHSTYYVHTGSISFLNKDKIAGQWHGKDFVQYLRGLPLHPLFEGRRAA